MNNIFSTNKINTGISGKQIRNDRLAGTYISTDGYKNTIFMWVPGVKNFILIEQTSICLSISDWDDDFFIPFNGTVEFNNVSI